MASPATAPRSTLRGLLGGDHRAHPGHTCQGLGVSGAPGGHAHRRLLSSTRCAQAGCHGAPHDIIHTAWGSWPPRRACRHAFALRPTVTPRGSERPAGRPGIQSSPPWVCLALLTVPPARVWRRRPATPMRQTVATVGMVEKGQGVGAFWLPRTEQTPQWSCHHLLCVSAPSGAHAAVLLRFARMK